MSTGAPADSPPPKPSRSLRQSKDSTEKSCTINFSHCREEGSYGLSPSAAGFLDDTTSLREQIQNGTNIWYQMTVV